MRRFAEYLVLTSLLAACDSASDPTASPGGDPNLPAFAVAGTIVDPGTLIPVPPPGAVCRADGNGTICHTAVTINLVNEPVFELTCGVVYETSNDMRRGIRWYNPDNEIVRRFVSQDVEGTWSLLADGGEPTVVISGHDNWRNVYTVPGDDQSGDQPVHGDVFTARVPGVGVIAHLAGLNPDAPDHLGHGVFRGIDDPAVAVKLCAALSR